MALPKADAARHDAANRLAVLEDGYQIQVPVVHLQAASCWIADRDDAGCDEIL